MHLLTRLDARWFQIFFLASFLAFGASLRDFSLTPWQLLLTFAAGLSTQAFWQCSLQLPGRNQLSGYLSAGITCFGICILVRADNAWVHPFAAAVAMSSKYVVRAGFGDARCHLFNPANLAAVLAAYQLPGAWVSQAQWGTDSLLAVWLIALGGMVTGRIRRLDISVGFLVIWACLSAMRLVVLGYSWDPGGAMWLQEMSNGALPLFAFFMISDPMTTPKHRIARLLYALAVAVGGFLWQFVLFRGNGLITALFWMSLCVPLLNHLCPDRRFRWRDPAPDKRIRALTLVPGSRS